jgi:hypothetical protein
MRFTRHSGACPRQLPHDFTDQRRQLHRAHEWQSEWAQRSSIAPLPTSNEPEPWTLSVTSPCCCRSSWDWLGLAITQVLQGFRGLMLARSRVRSYWPSVAWAVLLLVLDVQVWWAMYQLRWRHEWSFLGFAAVLAQTVPLYLLAGLVFPDISSTDSTDLRTHYYENHRWFFSLLILLLLISIGKEALLHGELPAPLDLGFQLTFIAGSLVGVFNTREWCHKALVPFSVVLVLAYIAILFGHLR